MQISCSEVLPLQFLSWDELVLPSGFQHPQAACSTGGMLTEITLRFVGKEAYGKVLKGAAVGVTEWPDGFYGIDDICVRKASVVCYCRPSFSEVL